MLIRGAELEGRGPVDVRIEGSRIASVAGSLGRLSGEETLDAHGGALIPGLHDHHLHLCALAASLGSVDCGARNAPALASALAKAAPRGGWIRGTGYHESVAGRLDRRTLDAWRADVAVRVQHRSGACWIVNSAGARRLGLDSVGLPPEIEAGVERDESGLATGALFGLDTWLRGHTGGKLPDLAEVGRKLARLGVTGVTDATPGNGASELAHLEAAVRTGDLPQRVVVMGSAALPEPTVPGVTRGARKIHLAERALPTLGALTSEIRAAHAAGRAVAVHCVTRTELVLTAGAFADAGPRRGDRIEHASVTPPDAAALLAELGLTVVTQPNFVRERGDAYLRDVDTDDQPWLYRAAGLLGAGVPLGGGTDAPFGDPDPWRAMHAAVDRRTEAGHKLGPEEALTPERALALFATRHEAPGGATRRVAIGARADLVLLDRPWAEAREALSNDLVAATVCAGRLAWRLR